MLELRKREIENTYELIINSNEDLKATSDACAYLFKVNRNNIIYLRTFLKTHVWNSCYAWTIELNSSLLEYNSCNEEHL